jgi:hypothetical protein
MTHGKHIVQGTTDRAVVVEHADRGVGDGTSKLLDPIQPFLLGTDPPGDIKTIHGDWRAAFEHDRGGMGVGEKIELGVRSHIARTGRPSHDHDLSNLARQFGSLNEGNRKIGQRPDGDQCNFSRTALDDIANKIDGVTRIGRALRVGQFTAVKSGFPMDIPRRHRRAQYRAGAAGQHRNAGSTTKIPDPPGVGLGTMQPNISGDGRYRQDVQFVRTREGQHQRDRVINAGIAIDDDWRGFAVHESDSRFIVVSAMVFLSLHLASTGLFSRRMALTPASHEIAQECLVNEIEIAKIERYLRGKFRNTGIAIEGRKNKNDSAEVTLDGEFIGVLFKDEDDGETSYDLHMTILDIDLE